MSPHLAYSGVGGGFCVATLAAGAALLLAALKESEKQSVIQAIPPLNKETKLFQAMYQIWLNKFSVLKIRVWVRQICMRFKFKI